MRICTCCFCTALDLRPCIELAAMNGVDDASDRGTKHASFENKSRIPPLHLFFFYICTNSIFFYDI